MRAALLVLALVLAWATSARAAEWQTIRPGDSTQEAVRGQFGQPSKVTSQKVEGYDSTQWLYEGEQAPRGITRMTIDFGLLTPKGYRADIVRTMQLQPKFGVFTRQTVVMGWGSPQGIKTEAGADSIFYLSGLIVRFDKDNWHVTSMLFTPPQPTEESAPKRQ